MTENHIDDRIIDRITGSVYPTHKNDDVVNHEAYNYNPRYAQGTLIERMKTHASVEITREDFATMNCATFINLIDVCTYIDDVEELGDDRAYPALCNIGRDRCYHEFKCNGEQDIFSDISNMMTICRRSVDNPAKRAAARNPVSLFNDVRTVKFRTTKQTLAIAVEHAKKCGVMTSHMNLYYTLVGLKYLVENESDYILLADKTLFKRTLQMLIDADEILNARRELLQAWMTI